MDGNNNHLYAKVTAEDGVTELYYHITVTRVDSTVPVITTPGGSLADGMAGLAYLSEGITASEMIRGNKWYISSSTLPGGIGLKYTNSGMSSDANSITGTFATSGIYMFTLTVENDSGQLSAPVEFSIRILEPSFVGFGGKQWFVVGDEGSGIQAPSGGLTLLAKDSYGITNFGSNNQYSGSKLKTKMDTAADELSTGEQASIVARNIGGGAAYNDGTDNVAGSAVSDTLFWPLSVREANLLPLYNRVFGDYWRLRSPGNGDSSAAVVIPTGLVNPVGPLVSISSAIRPAFYLDLSSVLFTSAAAGGKSSGAIALAQIYKFTMIDDTMATGFTATTTANNSNVLTVSYSGASYAIGETRSVSAVVKNSSGEATYYYNLKDISSAGDESGTVTINLGASGFNAAAGDTVSVFVEQHNGDNKTDFVSTPKLVAAAPAFTTQPSSLTKNAGENASFTVAASGSPAPTLQWQLSTDNGGSWSNIPSETSATLTVSNVQTSQSGNQYRCRATNTVQADVASNAATLTVQETPSILPAITGLSVSPATPTVAKGKTQQFTADVMAVGGADAAVTWSVDGTASTIDSKGKLTVGTGEEKTELIVTATSTFDPSKKATAKVAVTVDVLGVRWGQSRVGEAQGSAQQQRENLPIPRGAAAGSGAGRARACAHQPKRPVGYQCGAYLPKQPSKRDFCGQHRARGGAETRQKHDFSVCRWKSESQCDSNSEIENRNQRLDRNNTRHTSLWRVLLFALQFIQIPNEKRCWDCVRFCVA